MFFHGTYHRPRDHYRRGGGPLRVLLFRCLTGPSNCVPARVDLQVGRNDATEFSRDRGRKRRLDIVVAGVSPAINRFRSRHGCLYRLSVRRFFCCRFKLICKRWLASDKGAQFLANLDRVTHFRFPFAHHSGKG